MPRDVIRLTLQIARQFLTFPVSVRTWSRLLLLLLLMHHMLVVHRVLHMLLVVRLWHPVVVHWHLATIAVVAAAVELVASPALLG
jgi:hypothetical protein